MAIHAIGDRAVTEALAEFNRSGANVTYGNLLTVPVGDELMYVEPVYASLAGTSEANFPILRYVLVSYRDGVGIGAPLEGFEGVLTGLPSYRGTTPMMTSLPHAES